MERRITAYFLAITAISLFGLTGLSYAAYVGNPCRVFPYKNSGKEFSVFTDAVADITYDRRAKYESDDTKVDVYYGQAGLVYKNRFAVYAGAGSANIEESYNMFDKKIKWKTDYGPMWLAGAAFKLYGKELENFYKNTLIISFDMQYRNTYVDVDKINIDSAAYNSSDPEIDYSSIEYNDWHAAIAIALDMGVISPYIGAKYSDFESCVRVTKDAVLYQRDNAEADDNFGVFLGISFKPIDSLYASVEASFIDEDSVSASLTWKF